MSKLNTGVIDLVSKGPAYTSWARIMHANLASIMLHVVINKKTLVNLIDCLAIIAFLW